MNISNPFGSILVKFCSQVTIRPSANNAVYVEPACQLQSKNLAMYLNNQTIQASFNFSKGLLNTFSVNFLNCPSELAPSLISYWTINKLDSSELEQPIDRYCLVSSSNNEFVIPPNDLSFGTYILTAYVVDSAQQQNFVTFGNYKMNIVASSLVARLNSGLTFLELNWDENIVLDFYESSYDPDQIDSSDKSGMIFYLICTATEELAQRMRASILNLNFDNVAHQLNLAYSKDKFLYFYENNCFFK